MDLHFSDEDEAFRREARSWLTEQLTGEFADVRGRGGPGDEHALFDERLAWEQRLGDHDWTCVGWPIEHGGRGLTLHQQVIWYEEYARADGPGRLGHIGEGLAGPTIIHFGNADQQARFLPGITSGRELWCQGYSEPDAGSDLANVSTRAVLDGDEWVVTGQKVWTSLAHWADWCFVIARTTPRDAQAGPRDAQAGPRDAQAGPRDAQAGPRDAQVGRDAPKHRGLSYLLVPMRQDGVEIRPIRQLTGTSEFNEVFFDGARTAAANLVGAPGDGWKVAMGTLAFERGASTLGQQLAFENELRRITELARKDGRVDDPTIRLRLVDAWMGLRIMRWNTLRVLTGMAGAEMPREAMISKLFWATWHRELGNLAMDVLGPYAELAEQEPGTEAEPLGEDGSQPQRSLRRSRTSSGDEDPKHPDDPVRLTALQRLFLFSRSDTIYAGSNQIQRNLIGERALGLPPEPKVAAPTPPTT